MITANAFVDFFQNVLEFFFFNASQVGLRETPFIEFVIEHSESGHSFLDLFGFDRIRR